MPAPNPFEQHREAILMTAGELYRARRDHAEADPDRSRIFLLAQGLGDLSPDAEARAREAEAEVNVAARAVARLALIRDRVEKGGLGGRVQRFEIGITRVVDRFYVRDALVPRGVVDTIRRVDPNDNS